LANTVDIEVNADVAKAVAQLSKVIKKQSEITKGLTEQTRKSRKAQKASVSMGQKFAKSLRNVAISLAGIAGFSAIFQGIRTSIKEARTETILFENELTDLLSLGTNIQNISNLKAEVLTFSSAWGISRDEITTAMFDIQSGASSLGKEMRDSIMREALELAKVTGADLPTAVKVLLKSWNIYGDEIDDVNQAQNKLFKTAELGFLTFNDLAVLLPDVANAAKVMGVDFDTVLATLATATQTGGKTEKTFTGVRNVFLRMQKAQEAGIVTSSNFTDQLEELSRVDSDVLTKIFGAEAIGVIASLVANTKALGENLKEIKEVTGDIARSKFLERMGDASFVFAELNKSLEQQKKNQLVSPEYIKKFGETDIKSQVAAQGYRESTPAFLNFLAPVVGALEAIGQYTGIKSGLGEQFGEIGGQRFVQDLAVGGRTEEAHYASIYLERGPEAANEWIASLVNEGAPGKEKAAAKLDAMGDLAKSAANDLRKEGSRPTSRTVNRGE